MVLLSAIWCSDRRQQKSRDNRVIPRGATWFQLMSNLPQVPRNEPVVGSILTTGSLSKGTYVNTGLFAFESGTISVPFSAAPRLFSRPSGLHLSPSQSRRDERPENRKSEQIKSTVMGVWSGALGFGIVLPFRKSPPLDRNKRS